MIRYLDVRNLVAKDRSVSAMGQYPKEGLCAAACYEDSEIRWMPLAINLRQVT